MPRVLAFVWLASAHDGRSPREDTSLAKQTSAVVVHVLHAPELIAGIEGVPAEETFHFPGGLTEYLAATIHGATLVL